MRRKDLRSDNTQRSKSAIITVFLLVGIFTSNAVFYQQSLAQSQNQSQNNSSKSMSMSMSMPTKPSSSLTPESVTASVGDLVLTTFGSSAGLRVPDPGKPVMEVSWIGGGTFKGNSNVSDMGTAWVEFGTDGIARSHGQGMIMNQKGEVATYTFQAIGAMGTDGFIRNHGTVSFSTSATGEFASLAKIVGVYADQIDEKGNTVTKVWELK
jgi:hypothetical protein